MENPDALVEIEDTDEKLSVSYKIYDRENENIIAYEFMEVLRYMFSDGVDKNVEEK